MAESWKIQASDASVNTVNPIRNIVDKLDFNDLPQNKQLLSLAIGDPTKFGNLPVHNSAVQAVVDVLEQGKNNGYIPSYGSEPARRAIACRYSTEDRTYTSMDVIIGSGCSDVIQMTMCALMNQDDNILLPAPGFSLYTTVCGRYGFEPRFYKLDSEKSWEVNLEHLESLIDERTKVILINNPSNPCGSVYSREHLTAICNLALQHQLPIIADEIYADMVFEGETFVSVREVTDCPSFILGGLAKQYLAPGWRVGWAVIHDPLEILEQVRSPLISLTQVVLGANSVVQAAIPTILESIPASYYSELNQKLGAAANILFSGFTSIPQLRPIKPQGAMYLMVEILMDQVTLENDVEFCRLLLKEEAVVCLPGTVFNCPNHFRVVVCPPHEHLHLALERIQEFCDRYTHVQ